MCGCAGTQGLHYRRLHAPINEKSKSVQITTHIVIERPIREVFAFASNPCSWMEWIAGAESVPHTWSGQLDVGTTFLQDAPLASFWDDSSWEVTEYQPPRVFACRGLGSSCGAVRLLCEAVDGTTRVTICCEAAAGLFVHGPEVERAIQAQMQRDLTGLKHLLEATHVVAHVGLTASAGPGERRTRAAD